MGPCLADGAGDLFADLDSVEDLSEEETGEHGVDEGGDEAEDDKDDIGDLGESADPYIEPLVGPEAFVNSFFDKLFMEQFPDDWDSACEDVNGEYKRQVQVEDGDDEDEGGYEVFGDGEHGVGEAPAVGHGEGVVFDQEEERLADGQDPGDEEELAFVFH